MAHVDSDVARNSGFSAEPDAQVALQPVPSPETAPPLTEGLGSARPAREPLPRGFWPIWTTVVIDLIGFGIAVPVLGPFARRLGATPVVVGVIGAAFSLAQFVVAPAIGRLSDRIGRKPVLIASLIGTAIASFATAGATAPWMLIVARGFDGASGATVGVAQAAVGDLAPPHRRAQLLGLLGAAFGIGFTVGPGIAAIASWLGNERTPFIVAGVLAALNAIATWKRYDERRGPREHASHATGTSGAPTGLARSWKENGLPTVIGVSVAATIAFAMFEQMFTLFGEDEIGFTPRTSGIAFVIVGVLLSLVQGVLIKRVSSRVAPATLLVAAMATVGCGLVLLAFTSSWALLLPVLVLLAVGQGFATPTLLALFQNRVDPSVRGAVTGVQQRWLSGARVAAPLLAGVLYGKVARPAPFIVGAVIYACCIVVVARALRHRSTGVSNTGQ